MFPARQRISPVHALVILLLLGMTQAAHAQVGIRSGVAQVSLTARSLPQVSIPAVEPARQISRSGTLVEASTTVRWNANAGSRLMVRGGTSTNRIWVQDVNGEYQELTGAAPVTVARDRNGAGQREREVRYRVEVRENSELATPLPVLYEIAINPAF